MLKHISEIPMFHTFHEEDFVIVDGQYNFMFWFFADCEQGISPERSFAVLLKNGNKKRENKKMENTLFIVKVYFEDLPSGEVNNSIATYYFHMEDSAREFVQIKKEKDFGEFYYEVTEEPFQD